jgi:ATP synthase protein I
MSDQSPPPSRRDLDARLREAKAKRPAKKDDTDQPSRGRGLAFAMRIGVDLVAALIVGVGIGLLLDRWLGTAPWFLLLFFVLGAAAGMLNVYRVMSGYGYAAGYHKPGQEPGNQADQPDRKTPGR